ncbi:MAG: hypothetical protein LQ340_004486 [Diploschistes diacapsis]|nr:MAG: hypothetical protein LQ340_004486 [Diploschistes diacapsis]
MMDQYNKQASDYIFRENNAVGRVDSDTIDLHGQFVEEAEDILEARIRYAQQHGQTHLHVIVGKGNHSVNHIQKIKPRVEQICQELGLQYATEENEGRMYVNLQGGPAVMPPTGGKHHHGGHQQQHLQGQYQGYQQPQDQQQYSQAGGQYQQQQQQQYGQAGGQYQQQQQGGGQGDEMEQAVKKLIPRILQKMEEKGCCVVM